ncbi:MAG: UDP-N-acetylmuramate--L-alanine ligase [Candidatus Magasanikbacteria bacterium]|nr:UDP-N-acetylmuramate--L-alanine ligase [Candidatus Magasanikbacteria bacterium]
MNLTELKRVHFIGIGGINMSGVAKILKRSGIEVSGSDAAKSEATEELEKIGVTVVIGHDAKNIPKDVDLVIYSSAVPVTNPERAEAMKRNIHQLTNFEFLGEWTKNKRVLLITGTHGKSTTTSITGLLLESVDADPTVIVGSRVPSFPDGNVRHGHSDWVVIEGDEYAKHFLEFKPFAVIVNNIELDHTDIYPDLEAMLDAFREMLENVQDGGIVLANANDPHVQTVIGGVRAQLEARRIRVKTFGFGMHADIPVTDYMTKAGEQSFMLRDLEGRPHRFVMHVPGKMNVMNAAAALALVGSIGVSFSKLIKPISEYKGIWRRFQIISEANDHTIISDYGHHPTAVAATLEATKLFYPGRRILLAFQPHQRQRTKDLFDAFIPAFEKADALALVEIYDVAGRETGLAISSRDLQEAVVRNDLERGVMRHVEYAPDVQAAKELVKRWMRPGDVVLVMGAGDIYQIATEL